MLHFKVLGVSCVMDQHKPLTGVSMEGKKEVGVVVNLQPSPRPSTANRGSATSEYLLKKSDVLLIDRGGGA